MERALNHGVSERPFALVTQSRLFSLAGSETLTYELSRHLSSMGWDVIVATYGYGAAWALEFDALPRVRILRVLEPELESVLAERRPDIAWIHHQVIPPTLVADPGPTRFIFNHMSEVQEIEFPFHPDIERELASLVVFTAPSTVEAQLASGLLEGFNEDRFVVLGNPAPDEFRRDPFGQTASSSHRRLLVTTNHLAPELAEAIDQLTESWSVTLVGREIQRGATPMRVTPDLVGRHDAIVSIGKTVQYGLLSGVPVYLYDVFGGPGWLGPQNFELARHHNFSGRGFSRKTSAEIVDEINAGLEPGRQFANGSVDGVALEFSWSAAWARIERALEQVPLPSRAIGQRELTEFTFASRVIGDATAVAAHHESLAEGLRSQLRDKASQSPPAPGQATLERVLRRRGMRLPRAIARRLLRLTRAARRLSFARALERVSEFVRVDIRSWSVFYRRQRGPWSQAEPPRVVALIRVRNESLLMRDTLDHLAQIADAVVVFDDASTDDTAEIALSHPAVAEVIQNRRWRPHTREWEETANRRVLHERAKRLRPEWFFYSDADERFSPGLRDFLLSEDSLAVDGLRVRLFDAYMTPDDRAPYAQGESLWGLRTMFGPERRDILMAWRNRPGVKYRGRDGREPQGVVGRVDVAFSCQHYGKALSVEHWEETCDYYADYFPRYAEKWRDRRGRAIHTESDFSRPLATWDQVQSHNVSM